LTLPIGEVIIYTSIKKFDTKVEIFSTNIISSIKESKMSLVTALGISIGVLAGILCILCNFMESLGIPALAIAPWPGFIAWALYFAIGGKKEGLIKTMVANTAGAVMAVLIILLMGVLMFMGATFALAVAVVIGAFVLVVQSNWKPLSFIPAAFCGCAAAFGMGVGTSIEALLACLLSLWLGAVFALLSDIWGNAMAKKAT
jgi:hypothetical protein